MIAGISVGLAVLYFVSIATGAPVESTTQEIVNPGNETLDCNNENSEVYDQRQNGTENYRIHVNGVVVLVAPAETVLQAAQLTNLQMGAESEGSPVAIPPAKPKPKPQATVTDKVQAEASQNVPLAPSKNKNDLKLLNLLHMFRSVRHETGGIVDPHRN